MNFSLNRTPLIMKIICPRESFLNSFLTANSVIKSNTAKAILSNIKIEALPDSVVLMAGDSEIRIRVELTGVEVEEPGAALFPPTQIRSALTESKAESVCFETEGVNLVVHIGGSRFVIPTEDPQDFPPIDSFDSENYLSFPAADFTRAIRQTSFAADVNSGRAVFGGVLCSVEGERAHFVATDTRRMTHASIPVSVVGEIDTSSPVQAVIPKGTIQLAERTFSNSEGEIKVEFRLNRVTFSDGKSTLYAQLIEGVYPAWQGIFQKNISYQVTVNSAELISSVKQASIVVTDEYPGVLMEFAQNVLTLSGFSPLLGKSNITMNIDFPHDLFKTKLGPAYITEFLRVLDATDCTLNLIEGNNPVLFRPNDNLEYAIMPLSISK